MIAPLPKTVNGKSRAEAKRERRTAEAKEMRLCYNIVDERDSGRCRVCRKRGNPNATTLLDRLHRHHIIYRSRGGEHVPRAVLSICADCHSEIHVDGTLRLEGDADLRDAVTGRLCGIKVSRLVESGWEVTKWV
jgi:5-methylcytosine-specific restriction endonuclease McrA